MFPLKIKSRKERIRRKERDLKKIVLTVVDILRGFVAWLCFTSSTSVYTVWHIIMQISVTGIMCVIRSGSADHCRVRFQYGDDRFVTLRKKISESSYLIMRTSTYLILPQNCFLNSI